MRTSHTHKSTKAIQIAIDEIGGAPGTAAVVLFFAAARYLTRHLDAETAAEIAYKAADALATGERP